MVKSFADLWPETDLDGEELNWEWSEEDLVFRATDAAMRVYTLRPTVGEFERDDSEVEPEEDSDKD